MNRITAFALCLLACACHPKPAKVEDPFAAVNELIRAKDNGAAIQKLEALRAEKGEDPQVALMLMELYNHQDQKARAILRGRAAVEAHPDARDLYVPLAELYIRVDQFAPAKDLLLQARKLGVDDKEIAFRLGTCLANLKDMSGARAEFEKAASLGLDDYLGEYNLALLAVADGDFAKARTMFEEVVAKKPDYAPAKRELAHLILDQAVKDTGGTRPLDKAQIDAAMNLLWDVKDRLKDDARVAEAMGDGWLLLGDFDASVAAYTDALRFGQDAKGLQDKFRVAATKKKEADQKKAGEKSAGAAAKSPGGAPK